MTEWSTVCGVLGEDQNVIPSIILHVCESLLCTGVQKLRWQQISKYFGHFRVFLLDEAATSDGPDGLLSPRTWKMCGK